MFVAIDEFTKPLSASLLSAVAWFGIKDKMLLIVSVRIKTLSKVSVSSKDRLLYSKKLQLLWLLVGLHKTH